MSEEESEIKDLYNGNLLQIWEDDDGFVTISFGFVTVAISKEHWNDLKKEFAEVSKT